MFIYQTIHNWVIFKKAQRQSLLKIQLLENNSLFSNKMRIVLMHSILFINTDLLK